MKLSICILSGTDSDAVMRCLTELRGQNLPFANELLIASQAGVSEGAAPVPGAVLLPHTRGAAAAIRLAATRANGEMIAVIDPYLQLIDPFKLVKQVDWLDRNPKAGGCLHPVAGVEGACRLGVKPEYLTAEMLLASRSDVALGSLVFHRAAVAHLPDWFDATDSPGWALAFLLASGPGLWCLPHAMATATAQPREDAGFLAAAMLRLDADRDALLAERSDLRSALAETRSHPFRTLRALASFYALSALTRASPPLPARMATRMAKSAVKRDPERSLRAVGSDHTVHGSTANSGAARHAGRPSNTARPSIMIVTHDASRTGAPILALNLCEALSARYNVIVFALRDGELRPLFQKHATEVIVPARYSRDGKTYTKLVAEAARRHGLCFAIVNSLESVAALGPLRRAGVPTISLVHEFAAYTLPRSLFAEVVALSDDTVFSTELTLEDARTLAYLPEDARLHVIPQGKSTVPPAAGNADAAARDAERAWLCTAMRPDGIIPDPFLVLGAGTVHPRKGLDLFLDCAARVMASAEGQRFRFVWIGHGYAPETDMNYSAYLADQIRRTGMGRQIAILRQTAEIETAYRLSDLFLLSSRLDPLPNVTIDALTVGLPVLCFDRTTGIAEHLAEEGLGTDLVAPYLDTAAMAGRIEDLARDPGMLQRVRDRCREMAARRFDMPTYVRQIEALAKAALERRGEGL